MLTLCDIDHSFSSCRWAWGSRWEVLRRTDLEVCHELSYWGLEIWTHAFSCHQSLWDIEKGGCWSKTISTLRKKFVSFIWSKATKPKFISSDWILNALSTKKYVVNLQLIAIEKNWCLISGQCRVWTRPKDSPGNKQSRRSGHRRNPLRWSLSTW